MRLPILIFMCALWATSPVAWAAKPGSPLSITLSTQQPYQTGQEVVVQIQVVSAINVDQARVNIQPPAGMELLEGELAWQGSLSASVPLQWSFRCRLPATGIHRIGASVSTAGNPAARFAAHAVIHLGERPVGINRVQESPAKKSIQDGRMIREYPVR